MGQVFVNIEVGHERGGEMVSVPDVLVDTGSAHTTLPATLMEGLHIEPVEAVDISLPGGRIVTWNIGQARIRLAGHTREWTCPIYFCPEEEYLLGATTLEIFGLMVDPLEEGLVRKPVRARAI